MSMQSQQSTDQGSNKAKRIERKPSQRFFKPPKTVTQSSFIEDLDFTCDVSNFASPQAATIKRRICYISPQAKKGFGLDCNQKSFIFPTEKVSTSELSIKDPVVSEKVIRSCEQKKLEEMRNSLLSYQQQNSVLKEQVKQLKGELVGLKRESNCYAKKLQASSREMSRIKQRLEDQQKRQKLLNEQILDKNLKISRLGQELAHKEMEIGRLRTNEKSLHDLEKDQGILQHLFQKLRHQFDEKCVELIEMSCLNKKYLQEIQALKETRPNKKLPNRSFREINKENILIGGPSTPKRSPNRSLAESIFQLSPE